MRTMLVVLLVTLTARTAAADWVNPYNGSHWNNPQSQLMDVMITQSIYNHAMWDSTMRKQGHADTWASDFTPAKRRLVVQQVIESVEDDPSERASLAKQIDHVFAQYEATIRKDNVAHAAAFMLAASLTVAHGQKVDAARIEQLAVAINDQLAKTPAFTKASAADRQKLYETFITIGGLVLVFDADGDDRAKGLATEALAMFGLE